MKKELSYNLPTLFRKSTLLLLMVLFSLMSSISVAQQSTPCTVLFEEAFNKMRQLSSEELALSYSVETQMANDVIDLTNVSLRIRSGKSYVETKGTKMFRDGETSVVIDQASKVILITAVNESQDISKATQMSMIQDSLLNHLPAVQCDQISQQDANRIVKYRFGRDFSAIKAAKLEWLEYSIDTSTKSIVQVEGAYEKGHPTLKRMKVSYKVLDTAFSGQVFSGKALTQVYNHKGDVREMYSEYRLIDNLKKVE